MRKIKLLNRFSHIFLNGLRSILSPILSFVLSFIVIQNYSKALWGEFVAYLLYFFVVNMILNWGGKEFLLRQFSLNPSKMVSTWQHFFLVRIPILILIILTIPIFFSVESFLFLSVWITTSFITNAYMPIYLYKRDYLKVILAESISFSLLGFLIYKDSTDMNVYTLCNYYAIYSVIKMILYTAIYYPFLDFKKIKFRFQILWLSLPFLMLSLTGFFQSKIDLYVFASFHKSVLLADYQIISGFFIFSQSIATILLIPYVKNIYRMRADKLKSLSNTLSMGGTIINGITLLVILLVLDYFYGVRLTKWQILFGYLVGLPSYFYAVRVFYLFKQKKEKTVVFVSILSLFTNLTLSIILLYFKLEITGVLIANATAQLTSLVLYWQYQLNDQTAKIP